MAITQTIGSLGTPPSTNDPANFATNADALLGTALPARVTEMNTWAEQANTLAASMNAVAAGTALSIPLTFSSTTTDADPGAGYLRLDNATQNMATTIRTDLIGSDGSDWTNVINLFDDSTSTIKGFITLKKVADATKYLVFSVASLASPSGYKNITVACVASSAANPFADGDALVLEFTRNGDKGETGPAYNGAITASGLTMNTAKLLGRTTATSGAVEEITVGSGLSMSGGTLTASSGMTLLSTVAASNSATVDIETTFDSTYDAYMIVGVDIRPATDQQLLYCRFKQGGSYLTSNYIWQQDANAAQTAQTEISLSAGVSNTATRNMCFTAHLFNPAGTTNNKIIQCVTARFGSATAFDQSQRVGSNTGSTAALTGVRFYFSSGNISSGTFYLYGFKKA
ncbi:MAG TPA: hypothetical protein VGE12_10600 [Noviherbaspirillum sp.]